MRKITDDEKALFDIIKNNTDQSNYEICRKMFRQVYGIDLPYIPKELPSIWTIERTIRLLKQTYPNQLTNAKERQIKAEKESEYKEMAKDENKPYIPKNEINEQGTLGLFGEPSWW